MLQKRDEIERYKGKIWIVGTLKFTDYMFGCLRILERYDPKGHKLVMEQVHTITKTREYNAHPTYCAGACVFQKEIMRDSPWYPASLLVHEAQHGKQFPSPVCCADSEKGPMREQIRCLKELREIKKYRKDIDKTIKRFESKEFWEEKWYMWKPKFCEKCGQRF